MNNRQANFSSIPVINMGEMGCPTFREKFIAACSNVGFFYLSNHGINTELTKAVLELTRQFYCQSQQRKDSISIAFSPQYRGYGRLSVEQTQGVSDFKETLDLGLERAIDPHQTPAYKILHGPNQWPDITRFKETMQTYMQQMQQLGFKLMQELASAISSHPEALASKFDPSNDDAYAMLRLLHYPPTNTQQIGVGPHTDQGCFVFLLQDNCGGLQVQNHAKEWIDAPPKPDMFIVNIGEMLQRLTNNRFHATPHRVINVSGKHRYSAPFFFEPNLDAEVSVKDASQDIVYGEKMHEVFLRSFPNK